MYSPTLKLQILVLASAMFLVVKMQNFFQNPSRKVVRDDSYGGTTGGDYFSDYFRDGGLYTSIIAVRSITISYSDQVESIQVTYLLANKTLFQAPRHGSVKNINPPVNIKLTYGEYIRKIEGTTNGALVDQLSITTYRPRDHVTKKYGPFGTPGKTNFLSEGYVVAFFGRAGDMLDNIGVYHFPPAKKSPVLGRSDLLLLFDENPDTEFSLPVVKVNKLLIYHDIFMNSIQAQYQLIGGGTRLGKRFGGAKESSRLTVVKFESDEEILRIEGTAVPDSVLCQLTFVSRRDNTTAPTRYNGPFGTPCVLDGSTRFSVAGRVLGFFGTSDQQLYVPYGLGVYYS